jgi:hypothetical protein
MSVYFVHFPPLVKGGRGDLLRKPPNQRLFCCVYEVNQSSYLQILMGVEIPFYPNPSEEGRRGIPFAHFNEL